MSDRLATGLLVSALLRRVHQAGGSAMVLARGDADAGALLVITRERGSAPRAFERGLDRGGGVALIEAGAGESGEAALDSYVARRRKNDPDLWVIELDIADAQRFAAETILSR